MNEFKAGDTVRQTQSCSGTHDCVVYMVKKDMNGVLWIGSGSNKCNCQNYWELVKKSGKVGRPVKELPIKYVVFYDENDHDPMKTFSTEKELKKWITEVKDDKDVDFSSIRVFEVKKEFVIKTSFKLQLNSLTSRLKG